MHLNIGMYIYRFIDIFEYLTPPTGFILLQNNKQIGNKCIKHKL